MSLKENLKAKIHLDRLMEKIGATIRETPGQRNLNKSAVREILGMTDFQHNKVRDLHLYVRPLDGSTQEVLVLDNEIPIYHSTVEDVAMRKTPQWKEMFRIGNIKKILNDRDVIASKGRESLRHIHELALARLDFTYTSQDVAELVRDARIALRSGSPDEIRESLDIFFELLGYEPISPGILDYSIHAYGRPVPVSDQEETAEDLGDSYEHLVIFDEKAQDIRLLKGDFSLDNDLDLVRLLQLARGERPADLQGPDVFDFLGELALMQQPVALEA